MMMTNDIENSIGRILLSLRADTDNELIIHSIVVLAEKLKADLCALFVEDSDLMHVARLPFSREIIFPTASIRNIDSVALLRQIRSHAESLRRLIIDYARLSNVRCSFITREGSLIETVLTEAGDAQLIILMPEKYSARRKEKKQKLEQLINPVVLFYDATSQAKKSMRVIHSLIESGDLHRLKVLTTNTEMEAAVKHYLHDYSVHIDYVHIDNYHLADIIALVAATKPGLMLLPIEQELLGQGAEIKRLLDQLGCILLLVR